MKEAIVAIMAMFEKPVAKVAALAIICITVVLLSGCQLTMGDIGYTDSDRDLSIGGIEVEK